MTNSAHGNAVGFSFGPKRVLQGEPILDYASPRKRSNLRLPAQSRIFWFADTAELTVRERLDVDPAVAIGGLVFAAFTFAASIAMLASGNLLNHFSRRTLENIVPSAIPLTLQIVVAFFVIQQTWRRTILIVGLDRLELLFLSPFRNRRYHWAGNDIASVSLVVTAYEQTPASLAEMLIIRVVGSPVQLFTDHPASEVAAITAEVDSYFRSGQSVHHS